MRTTTLRLLLLIYSTATLLVGVPLRAAVSAEGEASTSPAPATSDFKRESFQLWGREVGFQPRVYGGAMYYDYEQDAIVSTDVVGFNPPAGAGARTLQVTTGTPFKATAWFPIVGGGGTFFVDRFFVDAYAQHAFMQSDSTNQEFFSATSTVAPTVLESNFYEERNRQDSDFDRTEWAVSAGYALTNNFSLFAGYRRADTDYDTKLTSKITQDTISSTQGINRITADAAADLRLEFEQDGPFVGFAYGLSLRKGIFDGVISFDFAVAFLDGEVTEKDTNGQFTNIQPSQLFGLSTISIPDVTTEFKGDAVGMNLGLHWKGFTPVEGLSYLIDIVGHRYDFSADEGTRKVVGQPESKQREEFNFKESVVNLRVGLAYTF
jgi:hypothetical protein